MGFFTFRKCIRSLPAGISLCLILTIMLLSAPMACQSHDGSSPATQSQKNDAGPSSKTAAKAAPKAASRPRVAQWTHRPYPADQINLIAVGDFGNGKPTQKTDAETMATYVAKTGIQFNAALTVGDNFYVHMKDVNDWQFQSVFEDMYDARRLNFQWFATAGNHDFEKADNGKAKIELEREYSALHPDSRWKCLARWYRVDFPQGAQKPLVTALMLDSSMPRMTPAEWEAQKKWIGEQLADSDATWKIACAHHPFFSNGSHGDNGVLQLEWGPIFKKGGLDMYIGGHDHDLQHLELPGWPISFVQAGGGGQGITDMRRDVRGPFSRKMYGFTHLQFFPDRAVVRYIGSPAGKIIHEFERQKATGAVTIISSTPRDKATTKPLKALIGVGENDVKPGKK
jgi:tartrate-resistant acid phosphatase type 5